VSPTVFRGGCLCGAVRFEITPPTKWCAHCHCSMCRRAHGAAWVTWVGVPAGQFRLTAGESALVRYASSAAAHRGFCSSCGSTLLFESARWADEVHVALANVEGDIDRTPQAHVYFDDRAPWAEVHDELPRRGGPTGTAPL
jgi:hypothetical protein